MSDWPRLDEPELLQRLAMDDGEFRAFAAELLAAVPTRPFDAEVLALALSYPWERPRGSYLLSATGVEPLAEMGPAERSSAIERFTSTQSSRLPVLAIGSNAAPKALARKFAHFPAEEDRAVLALTGRLHGSTSAQRLNRRSTGRCRRRCSRARAPRSPRRCSGSPPPSSPS